MKIVLDHHKSLHANAAAYFERAKKAREKAERVKKAITEVQQKISVLERRQLLEEQKVLEKIVLKQSRKREWFEKFHWFFTSSGCLCIAGRDAKQNELLVEKYFEKEDLFFHADVQGAAVTILKNGVSSPRQYLIEAAQFAACFSRAWKAGYSSADVYAVEREQVSKSPQHGEYLAKGAFVIRGKRKWFKNTELRLAVGKSEEGKIIVLPEVSSKKPTNFLEIAPGKQKSVAAKEIAGKLGLGKQETEELLQLLP